MGAFDRFRNNRKSKKGEGAFPEAPPPVASASGPGRLRRVFGRQPRSLGAAQGYGNRKRRRGDAKPRARRADGTTFTKSPRHAVRARSHRRNKMRRRAQLVNRRRAQGRDSGSRR